jgi:hypothetical protein
MVPADELARLHFQVTAGELARMPVAPAATLIPEVVEVDRGSRRHSPPQPNRNSDDDKRMHLELPRGQAEQQCAPCPSPSGRSALTEINAMCGWNGFCRVETTAFVVIGSEMVRCIAV